MKEEEKRETTLIIRNFSEKLDFGKFPIWKYNHYVFENT
jgi:hypothetical protein